MSAALHAAALCSLLAPESAIGQARREEHAARVSAVTAGEGISAGGVVLDEDGPESAEQGQKSVNLGVACGVRRPHPSMVTGAPAKSRPCRRRRGRPSPLVHALSAASAAAVSAAQMPSITLPDRDASATDAALR